MKKLLLLVFSATLVLFFNPNALAQQGIRVKAANNSELKQALSNPNVSSIEITQAGFYDELLMNAASGTIVVKGGDGSRAVCTYWIQPLDVCFDTAVNGGPTPGFVVDTAKAGTIGGQPDCPPDNAGTWTVLIKPGGSTVNFLADSNMHTMPFEADMPGQYQLEYRWDAFTAVQTDYYFYDVPVIDTLYASDDTVCGLSTSITFDYNMGFTSPDTTVVWTVNGADSSAVYPKAPGTFTFTAPSCGAYQLTLVVSNSLDCDADTATLDLYFYDDPIVSAGTDDSVCGLVYDGLNGTYTGATCDAGTLPDTSWSMASGPGTASFSAGMDSVTVTVCGAYEFAYTVTNGLCEDIDTVAVYFYDTPVVDAGTPDTVHVCGLKADLNGSYTVDCDNGITPIDTWSGDATFYANDSVEVAVCGIYTFYYKVDNGLCSATDSIVYMFHDTPVVDAGADDDVCGLTYGLTPGFAINCANGANIDSTWNQYSGPGTATFDADTVTVDTCGTYVFTYTVTNGPCSATDTVQIKFYDTPVVDAGANDDVCGLTYTLMPGYTVNCANGGTVATAWTLVSGPGTAGFTGNDVTVGTCGIYTFKYKVTNGPCADSAEVTIGFFDTPVVDAGANDDVCGLSYTLMPGYTVNCANGGTVATAWTLVSGPGAAGFTGNDVTVDTCGIYTFKYKVTNGPCADSAEVTIGFFDTPVVDAGADDTVCGLTYDLMPNYTVNCSNGGTVGTVWTKNSGPGVVIFSGNNVTVDTCGLYTFYYTVTNGPCTEVDSVDIFFSIPPDIYTDGVPAKVCGFVSPEFWVGYNADCLTGSETASWTTNAVSILPGGTTDGWIATVDTCGTYWFTYTVDNGYCTADSTIWIEFFETPNPQIVGPDTVYTCSEVEYCVTDLGSCNDPADMTFLWHVTGGLFTNGTITSTLQCDTVVWDQYYTTPGQLTVKVGINGLEGCEGFDTLNVVKLKPTLEGQVKYWNAFETYMPTPFSTALYSSYPFDYFYVTLYQVTGNGMIEMATRYVQPRLMEDLNELMSYFDFDIDTEEFGCDAEYVLKVWDGGLVYHTTPPPPAEETIIGASYTYNNWGGVNATDALAIQLMVGGTNNINGAPWNYSWVGLNTDSPWYGYYSHGIADVNSSNTYTNGGITALDALTAKYRAVGLLGSYPHNGAGNNQFSPNFRVTGRMVDSLPQITFPTPFDYDNVDDVPFTHSGTDYMYFSQATDHKYTSTLIPWGGERNFINLYYESIGDINASYVPPGPGLKAEPAITLTYEGLLGAYVGEELTIPVSIDRDAELGAITLSFNYNNDLIEVLGTNYADDDMFINQEEGILNIAWFSTEALDLAADASVAQIRIRVLAEIPEDTELFELNANTELADITANPIYDVNLKTIGVTTDKGIRTGAELTATNYPNPFSDATTISYILPEKGKVKVDVYNNVGMLVTTLVDEVQESGVQNVIFNNSGNVRPGVYFYHITVLGEMNNYFAVKRMIVIN